MANNTPPVDKRQQKRETNRVDKRKPSDFTVNDTFNALDRIDSTRLGDIGDDQTRAAVEGLAVAVAHLYDMTTQRKPPEHEPYGAWHQSLSVSKPTNATTTTSEVTAEVTLTEHQFYDTAASVHLQAYEADTLSGGVETNPVNLTDGQTTTITITGLNPGTEYNLSAVAECGGDTVYGGSVTVTTDPA